MGKDSAIEWTDHTFNPWWGCEKVSPACTNCYAEAFAHRLGQDVWGKDSPRRFFKAAHWHQPHVWDLEARRAGVRRRVFCASMADVFERRDDLIAPRQQLWDLIDSTPNLDWLLLTKRPENISDMVPLQWLEAPPANVWYGATAENQEQALKRIPWLRATPATVRFLSCEPLLGELHLDLTGIDWVICGGESGHHARPMDPNWARILMQSAKGAGAAFFFKQWGEWAPWTLQLRPGTVPGKYVRVGERGGDLAERVGKRAAGRLLDGREWNEFPAGGRSAGKR